MKKLFFFAVSLAVAGTLSARDLILEECFEYDAGRQLVQDTITKSDNFDPVTGWSTVANSGSGQVAFYISDDVLTYEGYAGSGIGNSLYFHPNKTGGQSVFKNFDHGIKNDSTIYIAFMIKFIKDTQDYASPDYFTAIKIEPAANSTNYTGRLYAMVESEGEGGESYEGEEVTLLMSKASTSSPVATKTYFTFGQTYLIVYKYYIGILNGKSAAEEAGNYDDEMWLYINPELESEPQEADIHAVDPYGKDGYRWTESGKEMGSLRGFYLRGGEPGKANRINPYLLGGVRIGYSWADVIGDHTGLNTVKQNAAASKQLRNGQLIINRNGVEYSAQGCTLK